MNSPRAPRSGNYRVRVWQRRWMKKTRRFGQKDSFLHTCAAAFVIRDRRGVNCVTRAFISLASFQLQRALVSAFITDLLLKRVSRGKFTLIYRDCGRRLGEYITMESLINRAWRQTSFRPRDNCWLLRATLLVTSDLLQTAGTLHTFACSEF